MVDYSKIKKSIREIKYPSKSKSHHDVKMTTKWLLKYIIFQSIGTYFRHYRDLFFCLRIKLNKLHLIYFFFIIRNKLFTVFFKGERVLTFRCLLASVIKLTFNLITWYYHFLFNLQGNGQKSASDFNDPLILYVVVLK